MMDVLLYTIIYVVGYCISFGLIYILNTKFLYERWIVHFEMAVILSFFSWVLVIGISLLYIGYFVAYIPTYAINNFEKIKKFKLKFEGREL